ncbi:hypothetical protein NQ315_002635 [Exocentrus adspersus]|uniref:HTH CENPB-type domain-containing protein n=1 Tax=Exocentrus adspersus TaxID=1586481 RepID=A0AAV8VUY7_9CUCU|nr:hypothetical protein NQ315_002635 [Exocentrus adspersus]
MPDILSTNSMKTEASSIASSGREMPRKYKKKLGAYGKRNYNPQYLERALNAVRQKKYSMRRASEFYGVPYTTLNHHFHNRHPLQYGGQPVLDRECENLLLNALQTCAEWGFPLKPINIREIVQQFLNKRGITERRFQDNLPGEGWFNGFMARHPELTIKMAENTKRVRAAVTYESIEEYFRNLRDAMKDVPPQNCVNYDETNFVDNPGAAKVVMKKGSKHAYRTLDTSKTSITVMFAIAGNGARLPPYVVYRAKHIYEGVDRRGIGRKLEGPKLLIGDNLKSHLTIDVIQECEKNDIKFVLLPPNSTHMLQPLDVAYFRPLKGAWRKTLEEWKLKNKGVIPKTVFPTLLKKAVESLGDREGDNARAGFKACGIVPFNPEVVLKKIKTVDNASESSMTQVLVEHLHQLKTGPNEAPKRGKKVSIAAGKSITSADFNQGKENKRPKGRKRQISISDEDEEFIDLEALETEQENLEINEDDYEIGNCSTDQESEISRQPDTLILGDFVITKYSTNKNHRFYISKILEISETEMVVSTLRKNPSTKSVFFTFPNVVDESVINKTQIVRKVNSTQIKRGRHFFNLKEEEELTLQ